MWTMWSMRRLPSLGVVVVVVCMNLQHVAATAAAASSRFGFVPPFHAASAADTKPYILSQPPSFQRQRYNRNQGAANDSEKSQQDRVEWDDDDDGDNAESSSSTIPISDAEALIACRNYLQRRKRWGEWQKAKERKEQRTRLSFQERQRNPNSGTGGFFWEDPSQLKYLHKSHQNLRRDDENGLSTSPQISDLGDPPKGEKGNGDNDDDTDMGVLQMGPETRIFDDFEDEEEDPEDEIWESVKLQGSMGRRDILPLLVLDDDRSPGDSMGEEFSPFYETGPSEEHVRRSQAKQKTWSNPEWRARWYEKRWGAGKKQQQERQNYSKALENRLQQIDLDAVLEHPALAAMTQEEIDDAIVEYKQLKRKKKPRKKTTAKSEKEGVKPTHRKKTKPTPSKSTTMSALEQFVFSENDNAAQEALREKRAERSRKAYQTRLENSKQKNKAKAAPPSSRMPNFASSHQSTRQTPQAALWRIEAALDSSRQSEITTLPTAADVELILEPQRLSRRKHVLLRIVQEGLGLRGKCIPVTRTTAGENTNPSYQFATTASVSVLGQFVLRELRKAESRE